MNNLIFVLFSGFLPLVLFLIEIILPISFLVEELGKFFLLLYFFYKKQTLNFFLIILAGVIFALTEVVFYTEKLLLANQFLILKRLLITGFFHSLTFVIFYLLGKKFGFLGLITALFFNILIHYFYNQIIVFQL